MALLNKTKMQVAAKATSQRAAFVRAPVVFRAQKQAQEAEVTRRAAIGMLAGVAALASVATPSQAAYGDAANVFGKATNTSGYIPYSGDGFAVLLPSKWNPSQEQDFPGVVLRYEDNASVVNNLTVIANPAEKSSIEAYGSPEQFLEKELSYLFGKQIFTGESISEGGFADNRITAASLLGASEDTDKKGKKYYKYELLVRAADNDEGGRHQLIGATVSNGMLYVIKIQAGDRSWFKGTEKEARGSFNSFTVA